MEEGREGALITIRRLRHRTFREHGAVTVWPLEEIPFPKSNHHSNTGCMSQTSMELGQLSNAKLAVSKFEAQLIIKCEQLKRVKLYLASRSIRRIPMGGAHLGGCWSPAPKA